MTAAALPSISKAQSFPTKAIQIIVPNAAGGVNDVLARIIAQKLQDQLGKPVVVENRPGAGGDIGTEGVLKAEPDGHTLVMGSIQLTLKPALYKTLRFDPRKDARRSPGWRRNRWHLGVRGRIFRPVRCRS